MRYENKLSRAEKKIVNAKKLENALAGSGLYLYENHSNADLKLPKPTKSGIRQVGPKQQFQGDDYYMSLVRTGFLRLIEVLQTPEQEAQVMQKEETMSQQNEKLILDQPDVITEQGKVEHVPNDSPLGKPQTLNEGGGDSAKQPDVLINEGPVDGGYVIVED
jgi:hypothetical protein